MQNQCFYKKADKCFLFGKDCARKVGCGEPGRWVEMHVIYTKKEKPGLCELYYLGCPRAHTSCCTEMQFAYCKHRPEVQKGYGTSAAQLDLQDHLKPLCPAMIFSFAGVMATAEKLEEKMKADEQKNDGQRGVSSAACTAVAV